jgi:hypothetical protein
MVKSRLARIAAIEARSPVDPIERAYPGLEEAVGRCYATLCAAFPGQTGVIQSLLMRDMGRRLRVGAETENDHTVLNALPEDALAVVGVDAKGFVEMLLALDEKI